MKAELVPWLQSQGYQLSDLGAHALEPADDYPDFAEAVAREVAAGRAERGILLCGSGVGACVAANKVPGIRACLCHDVYSAHQCVEHDNVNVLCLGAQIVGIMLVSDILDAFLNAEFSVSEEFRRRVHKLSEIELDAAHELLSGENA